jgi:glycosyltransferase involved in cell wall biosynthesis
MDISKEKLVSCIIPTRNRQGHLKKALDSVIAQTYRDLEIIVVDDASEDNTEILVNKYVEMDNRIKYFKNHKSLGGSGARNVGIRMAKGDYIAFLDDDDEWINNKIENQVKRIQNFDAVLCALFVDNKGRIRRYNKDVVELNDLRRGNIIGGTSILMAKTSVMKENLFDEELPNGQDWDIFIRITAKYKVGYLDKPLVIFSDGKHKRITNEPINISIAQLEKRMGAAYKHKTFLGPHWFNYRVAGTLLSYIRYRENKTKHIVYTIRRCGLAPVLRVFLRRIATHAKKTVSSTRDLTLYE